MACPLALRFRLRSLPLETASPIDQMTYRFVFSYDLWEEKFAVTRLEPSPRAISHLSAAAAEAWCLDSLMIPTGNLPADRPFWVSLTYRAESPGQRGVSDNSGLTLGGLVDIFSRRNQRQPVSGSRNAGPFRLIRSSEKMNRLRNRLILVFLAATIVPLIVTLFIMTSLLERSLSFATTDELDRLSKSLEEIGQGILPAGARNSSEGC